MLIVEISCAIWWANSGDCSWCMSALRFFFFAFLFFFTELGFRFFFFVSFLAFFFLEAGLREASFLLFPFGFASLVEGNPKVKNRQKITNRFMRYFIFSSLKKTWSFIGKIEIHDEPFSPRLVQGLVCREPAARSVKADF